MIDFHVGKSGCISRALFREKVCLVFRPLCSHFSEFLGNLYTKMFKTKLYIIICYWLATIIYVCWVNRLNLHVGKSGTAVPGELLFERCVRFIGSYIFILSSHTSKIYPNVQNNILQISWSINRWLFSAKVIYFAAKQ